jgi:hypothetical protein
VPLLVIRDTTPAASGTGRANRNQSLQYPTAGIVVLKVEPLQNLHLLCRFHGQMAKLHSEKFNFA